MRRLSITLSAILVLVCCGSSGCIYTIARAITDPAGLLKEAGSLVAAQNLQGLMTPAELGTLSATERMVEDLRKIAADNPDAVNSGELAEMADTLEDGLHSKQSVADGVRHGGRLRTHEVSHPWVIDGPRRILGQDQRVVERGAFPSVHTLSPAGDNSRILSMKSRLFNPTGRGIMGSNRILDPSVEIAAPIKSDYEAGGWGDEPPPDSMLSDPPPPPE